MIEIKFLVALIIYFAVIGPALKALRDIISFRWEWFVLYRLPRWLRVFLTDADADPLFASWDGWHFLDGCLMMAPLVLILWILGLPWWGILAGIVIGWCVFYGLFNLFFHRWFMRRKYQGR